MIDSAPLDRGPIRIALYSHDAHGLGHVRRHHAVAAALSRQLPALTGRPVTGLLISGTAVAGGFERPPGWDLLVLPALAKRGSDYLPRHLLLDRPALTALRTAVLTAALTTFRPNLLVVDRHPGGIGGELLPVLPMLRGTRTVLGLREVLDDPVSARSQWNAQHCTDLVDRFYHRIWVYGDRDLHDPFDTGELPAQLAERAVFTGYLANGRGAAEPDGQDDQRWEGTVLTMVGGGEDGAALAAAAAAAPVPVGLEQLVCTGPNMPADQVAAVRAAANAGTKVVRQLDRVPEVLARCAGAVVMGGYNTLCELLPTDTPALVVPRRQPRREQLIRARLLAAAGLVDQYPGEHPDPARIGAWLAGLAGRRTPRTGVDLDGLAKVAALAAAELAASGDLRGTDVAV